MNTNSFGTFPTDCLMLRGRQHRFHCIHKKVVSGSQFLTRKGIQPDQPTVTTVMAHTNKLSTVYKLSTLNDASVKPTSVDPSCLLLV